MASLNETRTMHLFAGHGGGLLADLILGHAPTVAVEWDGYACQVLRERAADGWFPGLQVWEGDVRLFDPSEYAGSVDCIHAGFPCQDISVAGKQAGIGEETRSGLYREVLRIAGVVRPKQLFLENVSAIVANGLATVLADIAALGYDAEWLCIRASDCGANHYRDRWFLLANANDDRCRNWEIQYVNRRDTAPDTANDGEAGYVADSQCVSTDKQSEFAMQRGWQENTEQTGVGGSTKNGANANSSRCEGHGDCAERGIAEYTLPGVSSWWEVEPDVCRVANGVPNRVHRLKGLGNAQVPLQAAIAYRLLGG